MSKIFQKVKTGNFLSDGNRHATLSFPLALHSNSFSGYVTEYYPQPAD